MPLVDCLHCIDLLAKKHYKHGPECNNPLICDIQTMCMARCMLMQMLMGMLATMLSHHLRVFARTGLNQAVLASQLIIEVCGVDAGG